MAGRARACYRLAPPMRSLLLLVLVSLCATTSRAEDLPTARLTDRGRIMLGGSVGGFWARKLPEYSEAAKWGLHAQPRVTYFVKDRLGIGLSVGIGVSERSLARRGGAATAKDWELWAGPSVLWDLPLTDRFSLFVGPGVYYSRRFRRIETLKQDEDSYGLDLGRAEYDAHFLRFALSLPLAFHISGSVTVGFGPSVWFDYFVSQDPRAAPGLVEIGPFSDGQPTRGEPYSRTRMSIGLASWLGGSF